MNLFRKRLNFVYILILAVMLIIFIRLTYLKIITNEEYFLSALELWTRDAPIEARRGIIYDRNNKPIVGNKLAPTVVVIPKQVEDKEYTSDVLAKILNVDQKNILKHLNKNVSVEILKPEGRKISVEQATDILKYNFKGVYVVADTVRDYAYDHYLAPVLGIVGIDNQGLTGLEYQYDSILKGNNQHTHTIKSALTAENFNIHVSTTYETTRQKIRKDTEESTKPIHWQNLVNI